MPLKGYVGPPPEHMPNAQPTVENLLKHYKRFGLSADKKGRPANHTSYSTLSQDSFIEVARSYLSEDAFIFLLGSMGFPRFEDAARADWTKTREDS